MSGEIDNQDNPGGMGVLPWSWLEWLMLVVERVMLDVEWVMKEIQLGQRGCHLRERRDEI